MPTKNTPIRSGTEPPLPMPELLAKAVEAQRLRLLSVDSLLEFFATSEADLTDIRLDAVLGALELARERVFDVICQLELPSLEKAAADIATEQEAQS